MKPTLPTYFLHIRHGHLSITQNLIFSLKLCRQISFLSGPGKISHILGDKDMFSAKINGFVFFPLQHGIISKVVWFLKEL